MDQSHCSNRSHPIAPSDAGLIAHENRVAKDLGTLGFPAANWPATVTARNGVSVTDVLVVGAGMNGIAVSASLLFKGIRSLRILDRNPAGRAGPWLTFARMDTLRSPKSLPGPALGIPSLAFRA